MPSYLSPGVYLEEVPAGIKPIQAAGTSTAAFVGHAAKGPLSTPVFVTNFAQFVSTFGGLYEHGYLGYAVRAFFDEGGSSCYVVRTCRFVAGAAQAVASAAQLVDAGSTTVLRVEAATPGEWGDALSVGVVHVAGAPTEFRLVVFDRGNAVLETSELSLDPASPRFVTDVVAREAPGLVAARPIGTPSTIPAVPPAPVPLVNGDDGLDTAAAQMEVSDYADPATGRGLHAFDSVKGIQIVAVPDAVDRGVHAVGMAYCEARKDCFYVADSQEAIGATDEVIAYKNAQGIYAGNPLASKYGALYAPWIRVFDPRTGGPILIPPSGAVAGVYARSDGKRGVHKAPAGIDVGIVRTASGVAYEFSRADQERLNPRGINAIRQLSGVGTTIWGARTASSDPEWRYLNVRRLITFIEVSIEGSTDWAVFEPNDTRLWKTLEASISAFLRLQWLAGALVGSTPEEAYYVKCDEETNQQETIDLGQVITEIGVAPSKPAEFVIFRIRQKSPRE